jgi:hypothetical protein
MAIRCDVNKDLPVSEVLELLIDNNNQTTKIDDAVGGQAYVCMRKPGIYIQCLFYTP